MNIWNYHHPHWRQNRKYTPVHDFKKFTSNICIKFIETQIRTVRMFGRQNYLFVYVWLFVSLVGFCLNKIKCFFVLTFLELPFFLRFLNTGLSKFKKIKKKVKKVVRSTDQCYVHETRYWNVPLRMSTLYVLVYVKRRF